MTEPKPDALTDAECDGIYYLAIGLEVDSSREPDHMDRALIRAGHAAGAETCRADAIPLAWLRDNCFPSELATVHRLLQAYAARSKP